jgi:hypothetical protein
MTVSSCVHFLSLAHKQAFLRCSMYHKTTAGACVMCMHTRCSSRALLPQYRCVLCDGSLSAIIAASVVLLVACIGDELL